MKKCFLFLSSVIALSVFAGCATAKKDEKEQPDEPTGVETIKIVNDKYYGYERDMKTNRATSGQQTFSIFGINDFHGYTKEDDDHIGIEKLTTFVKQKMQDKNNIFIDSGDAFQGSIESNYNYGKMIIECYNNAGITAMSLGNHDFDWGLNKIRDNFEFADFPFVCANVVDNDGDQYKVHQDDLCFAYTTKTLINGLKLGIIGTIGEDQITSINDNLVRDVSFDPQVQYIKNISDYLRTTCKCDLIISSSHSYYRQINVEDLLTISPVSNERYIDLMLNGHAHSQASYKVDDVYFVQTDSDGQNVEEITFTYDFGSNTLVDRKTSVKYYNQTAIDREVTTVDSEIKAICEKYNKETQGLSEKVLSNQFNGYFNDDNELPNLMAKSIYKECEKQSIDIDMAVVNYARDTITSSTVTYGDIFKCFPFDNEVHIVEVSGYEAVSAIIRNFKYKEKEIARSTKTTYRIAVLDYLAYHVDSNRNYDYFPTLTKIQTLEKNHMPYIYREVLKDYLLDNQTEIFNASDFDSSLENFSF